MRKLLLRKIKENKGFTGQDILIAIFLTISFLSLISAMMINLSNTTYEIEKTRQITDALTQLADKVDKMSFDSLDDTDEEKPIKEMNGLSNYENPQNVNITYTVSTEGNTPIQTKSITLIAQYSNKIASNKVNLTLKKQKNIDETGTPNPNPEPDPSPEPSTPSTPSPNPSGTVYQYPYNPPVTGGTYDGEQITPVKFVWTNVSKREGYWVTTTEDDKEWYSYEAGILPLYIKSDVPIRRMRLTLVQKNYQSFDYNVIAQNVNYVTFYAWIPRFGGTQNSYDYVVGTSRNKYTPASTGGYLKSSTTLSEYVMYNQRLFPAGKMGILNEYTKIQNNDAWELGDSWMLPYAFTNLFNQNQVFNRDIKNNYY